MSFNVEDLKLLSFHHVSSHCGFLLESPSDHFGSPYYNPWLQAVSKISQLLQTKSVREHLDLLPELSCDQLKNHRDFRLAHTTLTTLASAYVWCEGERGVPASLPRNIAVPLTEVSESLGVKPIICHMSACLANYKRIDPTLELSLGNMAMLSCKFIDEYDIDWFFLATAQIELDFVRCLPGILGGIRALHSGNVKDLSDQLNLVTLGIAKMTSTLARLHDRLRPDVFYSKIRPFLAGYESLPDGGLILEGVESKNPHRLYGGSAAQSSTLPTIDGFLGVKHESSVAKFLLEMRSYMPPAHAQFIEVIEAKSQGLRDFVIGDNSLIAAYNSCIQAVVDFRSYHIQIITKYILTARAKSTEAHQFQSLSTKGTGGTGILPFLKSARDRTIACLVALISN